MNHRRSIRRVHSTRHEAKHSTGAARYGAAALLLLTTRFNSCSAFITPLAGYGAMPTGWRHQHVHAGGVPSKSVVQMASMEGDGSGGVRDGLAKQEFRTMLNEGSTKGCLNLIQRSGNNLKLDMSDASQLLSLVSNELLEKSKLEEESITQAYTSLKAAGLLNGFGSIDLDVVPSKTRTMSPDKLMELTGMNVQSLAPGRPTSTWLVAGAALFGSEVLLGQALGVDPLTTIVPLTLGIFVTDRVVAGGAAAETLTRAVVPGYRDKIVRHEGGHFLLAYLLGCPVQGCLLDPFTVGKYARAGAQGGTIFADPVFAKGMASGKLTRSAIDRFSIVLMGGIAAEAIQYGNSEGGSADEGVLIEILSTIAPPFNMEQIKSQALWAATQAVLLINEHKEAYEALVGALDSGAELGECVSVLEGELGKRPLPGDIRRQDMKPASPADEVRGMVIRRMSQNYWKGKENRQAAAPLVSSPASEIAEEDRAMLDLQRRVEDLERSIAGGGSVGAEGASDEKGGVWMNDLKALREDIAATNRKNQAAALDSAALSPGEAVDAVMTAGSGTAVASRPVTSPSQAMAAVEEEKLKDIETKTAENAKRMAEVEEQLRRFEEERAR